MKTYICILRGINVSGKNMIKMPELKKQFEDAGFQNVKTYIQSGNVVFQAKDATEKQVKAKIEKLITEKFGLQVPVLVRDTAYWQKAMAANPFLKMKDMDAARMHITFLADEPAIEYIAKIKDLKFEPDLFVISGTNVYVYCPNGYGNSKIHNGFFESKLKVTATTRNWNTVNELMKMAGEVD